MFMSFIFKYTILSLQGHICLLQGHKMCTRARYFNASGLLASSGCIKSVKIKLGVTGYLRLAARMKMLITWIKLVDHENLQQISYH